MSPLVRYGVAAAFGAVVATKELERRGVVQCGCPRECWCRTPGPSLLRWILPLGHGCRPDASAD